ncbi:hypothetical protein EV1_030743 [Malus domestica]
MVQRDMTIAQYFHKVKSICREISELDPTAPIGETRMKRIIIHGLRPEYRGFIAAIQGWPAQPSLVEFENLLAGQEAMAKQMGGVSLKSEEEALYTNKSKGIFKRYTGSESKKDGEKVQSHQGNGGSHSGGAWKNRGNSKKFSGKCYNCGKMGHMAKDCWAKKKSAESNAATSSSKENNEDGWDAEALFATEEEELALTVTTPKRIDYNNDWIVDSGCSNHMTGDKQKLQNLSEYKGSRVVVTADNSRLPIAHIGKMIVTPSSEKEVLPDSREFGEKLQQKMGEHTIQLQPSSDESKDPNGDDVEQRVAQNPLQTDVYQQPNEEGGPSETEESTPQSQLRRSTRTRRSNPKYANAAIIEESTEPETFEEASQSSEWMKAMKEEIDALQQNQTWDLVPKPRDVKSISCKWVYKIKRRPDGSIERYKARLVARGFSQQYGLDYDETFSPVAKLTTVRVLLALAANKDWNMWQMDVKNAFLHGELDREIYMMQPMGFKSEAHPEYVCKLRKALYGLKQAPRAWYGKIAEFLTQSGYSVTPADSSLFVKANEGKLAIVLVYVDDLIITGDDEAEILRTKENLSVRFQMKELGQLKHFLGLEIDRTQEGIFLCQQKYSKDLLKKFGMLECKPTLTPMEPNAKMCAHEGKDLEDATMYRQLVGSLIYLTLTRPDISYAVGVMSRYMQNPKKPHLEAVRRILRYVKSTIDYGLLYKKGEDCKLVGYCDADYAGDHDTRRSTTGYVFKLGSGTISWCSKRQPTVSLSTTEAEYRAAAMAAQENAWLVQLMSDLHQPVDYSVPLYCDNQSAIRLAENPVFHARTKHVEVHYHFIREKVLQEDIEIRQINTDDQIADLFTKGLSTGKFEKFRRQLSME